MGIDHVFHRIGNNIAAWQRVKHAVVSHGDAVVDGNGIKLRRIATELLYFRFYYLTYFVQMRMPRHKLRKRIDDGDNGFSKLFAFHSVGYPQSTCSCHTATFGTSRTA